MDCEGGAPGSIRSSALGFERYDASLCPGA